MKKVPQRMCLGCRCMKPKKELLRLVRSLEGGVTFDPSGKVQGRGAYVCTNPECWNLITKTKALQRTFKTAVSEEVHKALSEAYTALVAEKMLLG